MIALGGCIGLARRGVVWWQSDLAGLVGYVALGAAFAASASASGWVDTDRGEGAFVVVASLVAVAVVVTVHRETGSPLLFWVGMPAALAALGIAAAELAGLLDRADPRVGDPGRGRRRRGGGGDPGPSRPPGLPYATVWATLGGYAAVVFCGDDLAYLSVWHLILAGVVIAAFLTAAALDFDALIWIAAAGGAWWVLLIAVVVGSAAGAALAVVLAGIGLVGLGLLVARLRRAPRIART